MPETTCARCETQAESQWRVRLEQETEAASERASYRLCRECWDDLGDRFAGDESEGGR